MAIDPITRREMFMAKAGGQNVNTPTPVTREEMFLSKIGGASSWNDLTDKPFYEETSRVEVLAECQPTYSEADDSFVIADGSAQNLVAGETYIVKWNDTEYTCVGQDASERMAGVVAAGDGTNFGLAGNGEPFLILSGLDPDSSTAMLQIIPLDGSTSFTLSIYQDNTVIHPIEGKYLPNNLAYTEKNIMLPEMTFSVLAGSNKWYQQIGKHIIGAKIFAPYHGHTVTVVFDGVEYTATIIAELDSSGALRMIWGNRYLISDTNRNTYEPFCVDLSTNLDNDIDHFAVYVAETDREHTIEIYVGKSVPTDCLPHGTPCVEENAVLLKESSASSFTHPSFGTMWGIYNGVPDLNVGEIYTINYNGVDYKCECQTAPSGLVEDPNAVAMGNFSVVGGQNTGEPFAMLISCAYQEVDIIDMVGSSSVNVKISGLKISKMDSRCLPDDATSFTLVSPNGTKYAVTVSDDGILTATAI